MKTFCPNCEKDTECEFTAELYECKECGEDFAKYIVARNPNIKNMEQVGLREQIIGDALCENLRTELKELKSNVAQFIAFVKTGQNAKAHLQMLVVETFLEEKHSNSDVSVTQNVLTDIKTAQSNEMENPKMTLKVTVDPYVEIFYNHIKDLNTAIDRLCPLVARAITKVTPPSIGRENTADFDLARAMREALDELTEVQNREYRDPNGQELLDTSKGEN